MSNKNTERLNECSCHDQQEPQVRQEGTDSSGSEEVPSQIAAARIDIDEDAAESLEAHKKQRRREDKKDETRKKKPRKQRRS